MQTTDDQGEMTPTQAYWKNAIKDFFGVASWMLPMWIALMLLARLASTHGIGDFYFPWEMR